MYCCFAPGTMLRKWPLTACVAIMIDRKPAQKLGSEAYKQQQQAQKRISPLLV